VTSDTVPMRSDEVVHFPAAEQLCLHHLDSGEYFLLNDVGSAVWDLCNGEQSVAEIADELTERFEVDREVALADAIELLEQLEEQECVVPAPRLATVEGG
jgi:hypothetical protein